MVPAADDLVAIDGTNAQVMHGSAPTAIAVARYRSGRENVQSPVRVRNGACPESDRSNKAGSVLAAASPRAVTRLADVYELLPVEIHPEIEVIV